MHGSFNRTFENDLEHRWGYYNVFPSYLARQCAHSGEIDDKTPHPPKIPAKHTSHLCFSQHPARDKSWGRLQYFTTFFELVVPKRTIKWVQGFPPKKG